MNSILLKCKKREHFIAGTRNLLGEITTRLLPLFYYGSAQLPLLLLCAIGWLHRGTGTTYYVMLPEQRLGGPGRDEVMCRTRPRVYEGGALGTLARRRHPRGGMRRGW